jgi:hypothetical protein
MVGVMTCQKMSPCSSKEIWTIRAFLFAQVYDNIGFRKDVPEEIRGQFVLCPMRVDNPPTISSK